MDRKIKLSDLKSAVQEAYDNHKNDMGGTPSPKVADMNQGMFGISVRLTDGTKFDVGTQSGPVCHGRDFTSANCDTAADPDAAS